MAKTRDWQGMKDMSARLLKERTGEGVGTWNRRIQRERLDDEESLRLWLTKQGVTGYAQSLLVMERFGYPDFLLATADELIDGQYADRAQLRPIFAFQFPHGFFSGRSVTIPPFRSIARAARFTSTTEK